MPWRCLVTRLTACVFLGSALLAGCGVFLYDRGDMIGPLPPDRPLIKVDPDAAGLFANSSYRIIISGPGSIIRYTTNGSDPRTAGLTYTLPVTLSGTQPLVILAVSGSDGSVWSQVASNYLSFGNGTAQRPWHVANGRHLSNIRHRSADHFRQVAEIDLSNVNWIPVGDGVAPFTGHYTTLSNYGISGLAITTTGPYTGLFGYANSGATFSNIIVNGLRLHASGNYAGGLCGYTTGNTIISGCQVLNASITNTSGIDTGGLIGYMEDASLLVNSALRSGTVYGLASTGGLVGHASGSTIAGCWISGTEVSATTNVGGLAGMFTDSSTMLRSYSAKSFMSPCTVSGQQFVGGLVGSQATSWISNSFSFSAVTATGQRSGGLVGYVSFGNLMDCYSCGPVSGSGSMLGGFVGAYTNTSTLTRCYAAGSVTVGAQTGVFAGSS